MVLIAKQVGQPVDGVHRPRVSVCRHPVGSAGQCFVRPAADERIDELVNSDEQVFPVVYAVLERDCDGVQLLGRSGNIDCIPESPFAGIKCGAVRDDFLLHDVQIRQCDRMDFIVVVTEL